jgi:hypothetical protein
MAVRVYTIAGSPLRIVGEASVPRRVAAEHAEGRVPWYRCDFVSASSASQVLTLDELMDSREGRRALEAWRNLDDTGWDELYEREHYESTRRLVEREAARGCPTAADLLDRAAPADEIEEYENSHVCENDHPRLRVVR